MPSVQTIGYATGEPITQNVDTPQVLAQDRETFHRERPVTPSELSQQSTQRAPLLGILSQTLIRSPVAKWIIQARIRHKDKNDVLFIYENLIEIHEVVTDEKDDASEMVAINGQLDFLVNFSVRLKKVAVKTDMDSLIRSAGVFGLPRRYTYPMPDGVKVKEEEQSHRAELPPQILVLALASGILAFIFGFHDGSETIRFFQCRRPLPMGRSGPERLGEHLAIDPMSRAMAVAAQEGSFSLYALKSMSEIRGAVQSDDGVMNQTRFQPIKEERHFHIEGHILKMEFLHTPEGQGTHNRVILLLIISRGQRSRLVCYEWDSATSLANANPVGDGHRLRADEQLPLLLIPLKKSTAFMLVFEKRFTVYKDILTGNPIAHTLPLCTHESLDVPPNSQKLPIWTQWARPHRHDIYSQNQDNIYLCREDGVVDFLEFKSGAQMIDSTHHVGELGVNVLTAFASIDLDLGNRPDLLVVSGDECDGGGWLFEARRNAAKSFVISNWTSMVDFMSTDDVDVLEAYPHQSAMRLTTNKLPKRLFACTGRGKKHGGLTEIRYGVEWRKEVKRQSSFGISQIGVLQMWVLDGFAVNTRLILLSYPTHTSLFRSIDKRPFEEVLENDYTNIDFDSGTLAAGASSSGLIVQVTKNSLQVACYGLDVKPFYQMAEFVAACVRVCGEEASETLLLLACVNDSAYHLHLSSFELDRDIISHHEIGSSVQVSAQPTFVSIERVGREYFAFVGTAAAILQVFRLEPRSGLTLISDYNFEGTFAVCDTVAVLDSPSGGDTKNFILCGLRNGTLQILRWNQKFSSNDFLVPYQKLQIGNTSVTVSTDCVNPDRAILLCDQKLHILRQASEHSSKVDAPLIVNNVYLTDSGDASFQHGQINAIVQCISEPYRGSVFSVESSQVYLAKLWPDNEPGMIPRRIRIGGTPKRVKYSPKLDKLIVLYYFTRATQQPTAPDRQYSIALVNPDAQGLSRTSGEILPEGVEVSSQFKPGEITLGVTEWFPQGNSGDHHVLVVHTLLQHATSGQSSGRICLFSISTTGGLSLKKAVEREAPVHALTTYGSNSLLYSCGNELFLQTLSTNSNSSGWKFQDCSKFALFSQVRHISICEPFVYVSTSDKSLLIFKVKEKKLVLHFNDDFARDNLFHLVIPRRSLILTSQTRQMITGLWQPAEAEDTASVKTVFQAALPGSITRFRRIDPLTWKQGSHFESSDIAVASMTDGSLFQLNILDEDAWRLLAFIQMLAFRSPGICPFVNHMDAYRRSLEPSSAKPIFMHIKGDILRRILERGGERSLLEMISPESILKVVVSHEQIFRFVLAQQTRAADITSAQHNNNSDPRMKMAIEFTKRETQARQKLMWKYARAVGLDATNAEDLVAMVIHWMIQGIQHVL